MAFIVNPNFYHVLVNGTLNVAAPGYLDNDFSTVGTVTPVLLQGPQHGTWSTSIDGSFQYTPNAGFTGIDTVTVRESNGIVSEDSTITIDVYDTNDARVLVVYPNFYHVAMNGVLEVAAPGYLDNDFTTMGTLTAPALIDAPDHGTWSALINGFFRYTPNAGFIGVDTVTVSVFNGTVVKSETITIEVYGPNDAPTLDLDANDTSGATGANYNRVYIAGRVAVAIADGDSLINDVDDSNIESATITIANAKPDDLLSVSGVLPSGITVSGASTATNLILTGSASKAAYESALEQVRFSNTSPTPDSTTRDITVVVSDGTGTSNTAHASIVVNNLPTTTANDFNADGTSDVLWRHVNGFTAEWEMNAGQIVDSLGIGTPSLSYLFQATGDFNGDGRADVLWRHDSGQVVMWEMDGNQIVANQSVATPSSVWHNEGAGDLTGDGHSDILWRHDTGQVVLWEMDGANIVSNQSIATPGNDWHVQGLADTGGDGKSDVLLRHNSGQVVLWTMDGAQITANQSIANVGLDWNIAGTGDFNGDGKEDILWRNDSGQVALWEMDGANIVSNQSVGTPSNAWRIQAVGDYNADGHSDVLWRHDSGQVAMWEMDGAQIASNHAVTYQGGTPAPIGSDWTLLSHHYDVL